MAKPILRSDIELKNAVADALSRHWIAPEQSDGSAERLPLREMRVSCEDLVIKSLAGYLPKEDPAGQKDFRDRDLNLLLSEVVVFCPVGLPGWQHRANIVLQEQVRHYRTHLDELRKDLDRIVSRLKPGSVRMYAAPFGRFLSRDTKPEEWVSEVRTVPIVLDKLFENCQACNIGHAESASIHYFIRPYIVWPVKPGTLNHVTHCHGENLAIPRKELIHTLLQQDNDFVPASSPTVKSRS